MITFLCSPNNPTGLSEPLENVRAALDGRRRPRRRRRGLWPVRRRRLRPLFGEPDASAWSSSRTFSKTWALAGVRLGYAVAAPEVVDACFGVCLPYHLSSLTQAGRPGRAAASATRWAARRPASSPSATGSSRPWATSPVELWPSEANFILFRPDPGAGSAVWQGLLERSVLVRDCSSWRGLEGCLRVTIGTPEENDRFLAGPQGDRMSQLTAEDGARRSRSTKETTSRSRSTSTGAGRRRCRPGIPFFDHMVEQLGRHGGFDLEVEASGDLSVDLHHTVEDVGIVLGEALAEALGDKRGSRRYASRSCPSTRRPSRSPWTCRVARSWSTRSPSPPTPRVSASRPSTPSWSRSSSRALATAAGMTLHVRMPQRSQHAPHRRGDVQVRGPLPARRGRGRGRCPPVDQGHPVAAGHVLAVIDYGIGNLRSAVKAMGHVGERPRWSTDPDELDGADGVVLPGVGAFGRCAEALDAGGWRAPLRGAIEAGVPFLGICVGFQLLYERLGRVARVRRASASSRARSLGWPEGSSCPQIQWNQLELGARRAAPLPSSAGDWMYFVHSYAPPVGDETVAVCDYGGEVAAAVERGQAFRLPVPPREVGPRRAGAAGGFAALAEAALMDLLPAIDLRGGGAVRLAQRRLRARDSATATRSRWPRASSPGAATGCTWSTSTPPATAWPGQPAPRRADRPASPIPVETGGGIRTAADVDELLEAGVQRVILGTAALESPELLAARRRPPARARRRRASTTTAGGGGRSRWRCAGWLEGPAARLPSHRSGAGSTTSAPSSSRPSTATGRSRAPTSTGSRGSWPASRVPVVASGGVAARGPAHLSAALVEPAAGRSVRRRVVGKALVEGRLTRGRGGGRVRATRVIPCLDVDAGRVVKGVRFVDLFDAGDPVELAARYDAEGADEICFLDITASLGRPRHHARRGRADGRRDVHPAHRRRRGARGRGRTPAPSGRGGEGRRQHARRWRRPPWCGELADEFGAQCVVVAIDARLDGDRLRGRDPRRATATGLDAVAWAERGGAPGRGRDPADLHGPRRHPGRLRAGA